MGDNLWLRRTVLALLAAACLTLSASPTPFGDVEEDTPRWEPPSQTTFPMEETRFLIEPPFDWEEEHEEEQPAPPPAFWSTYQEQLNAILDEGAPAEEDPATGAANPEEPGDTGPGRFLPDLARPYIQTILALLIVLGVFILLAYGLRRLGQRTSVFPQSNVASVIGRVYLTPRVSLHFIRTGDKVLVVGVGQNEPSLLTEFPADSFEQQQMPAQGFSATGQESRENAGQQRPGEEFWAELQAKTRELTRDEQNPSSDTADVNSLRDDIQRLRKTLQESSRDRNAR
ncbi:MAG: FliO/MopB family protein [Candidatus Hydrogenedentota bacterium]